MPGARGVRIGVCLGSGGATGVILGRRGAPMAHVGGPVSGVGDELGRIFGELKSDLEAASGSTTEGARLYITLLPPLVDARLIPFPPMRKEEAEVVLTRDAARHFLGEARPRMVGVQAPTGKDKGKDRPQRPVFAAAAALELLERVRRAASDVGWRLQSVAPAHASWLAAAGALKGPSTWGVVALVEGTAHILRSGSSTSRTPEIVRQLPAGDPLTVASAVGPGPGTVLVLAPAEAVPEIRDGLARRGWSTARDPDGWTEAEPAAAGWADRGGLEIVPPGLREERRAKRSRRAFLMLAGAVVLALASAGAHLWGAQRELQALQARRAALRAEIQPLLAARDSLDALLDRVRVLSEIETEAPLWTRSLAELTTLLPPRTYLTAFYATGDTVELEAAGIRAGEAIQRLRESGIFEDVRLQGMVERELNEGETVEERFSLRARLPARKEGGLP